MAHNLLLSFATLTNGAALQPYMLQTLHLCRAAPYVHGSTIRSCKSHCQQKAVSPSFSIATHACQLREPHCRHTMQSVVAPRTGIQTMAATTHVPPIRCDTAPNSATPTQVPCHADRAPDTWLRQLSVRSDSAHTSHATVVITQTSPRISSISYCTSLSFGSV